MSYKNILISCLGGFICKPLINHDTYMTIDGDENHIFSLSGMDDKIRNNYKRTHPIGTIITCECSGFTDKGVPRFGRYLRKRTDIILKESDSNSSEKLEQIISIFEQIETMMKNNKDYFKAKAYGKVIPDLKKLEKDSDLTEENYQDQSYEFGFRYRYKCICICICICINICPHNK